MPECFREQTRTAHKQHYCDMCNTPIVVGEIHHVSTHLSDGRVYDWRTCAACDRDGVTAFVYDWSGCPDEGVGYDSAVEWAADAPRWAKSDTERASAVAFAARAHLESPDA